jgi:SWI/SNF-related matrix-associated actin-dependent regulator 1 of chromatin subfamily A
MKTKLYPTQLVDIEKAANTTDLPNYSEPGTGKTLNTVGLIERLKMQSGLIVCPTIATIMWKEAIEYELGAKVQWLKTRSTEIDKTADFLVASYGVINAHFANLMLRKNDILVIDEAHKLKNKGSDRTELMFGPESDGADGLYETSLYCEPLTGTPMERYADDLWSQLRALHPDTLNRYKALEFEAFRKMFCRMGEVTRGGNTFWTSIGNSNERLLNRMLYNEIGIIRRTMAEVAPHMRKMYRTVTCEPKLTKELIAFGKQYTPAELEAMIQGVNDSSKMRQMLGLAKAPATVAYALEQKEPLLVGYWHTAVGQEILAGLTKAGISARLIDGSVSPTGRDKIKKAFQSGEVMVIVGQIAAMGEALDGLQQASRHVIIAEDDWSDAKVSQFYKRLYRGGQDKPVIIDFIKTDHPLDTALSAVRERKREGAEVILE